MTEPSVDQVNELQRKLRAAEETINALKTAANARMTAPDGGQLAIGKAIATLQGSLALRSKELQRTEASFRTLFEHSPLMAFTVDQDGRITHANQVAINSLHISLDMMQGSAFVALFNPESAERLQEDSNPFEASLPDLVLRIGRQVDMTVAPIPGFSERQILLHDVTEQRLTEKQLHHSQRMDSVGQLAGGIAHDFNNQLCGIVGYAELLLLQPLANEGKTKQYLRHILTACSRAEDLVTGLLVFSRRGRVENEIVDLHKVINSVIDITQHAFDRRISIVRDLQADAAMVLGDASQLESAFMNLALNARDAMSNGGELRFQTRNSAQDSSGSCHLDIRVQDTGTGISTQTLPRIFEPFFTTKPPGLGTGIGLAAVYGTIQSHQGSIEVQSEVGAGTSFNIRFPVAENAPANVVAIEKIQSGQGTILLVDDDQAVRESSQELLQQLGYQVKLAACGTEALEIFEDLHSGLDLVILDLIMPDLHGSEVLKRIRGISSEVPVLLISGFSAMEPDFEANDYLPKPFTAAALSSAVFALIGER